MGDMVQYDQLKGTVPQYTVWAQVTIQIYNDGAIC